MKIQKLSDLMEKLGSNTPLTQTSQMQVVMACDLVATMLFVFCHVVSTIEVKTENGTASDVASEDSQNERSDHRTVAHGNHMDTPKLIPEP